MNLKIKLRRSLENFEGINGCKALFRRFCLFSLVILNPGWPSITQRNLSISQNRVITHSLRTTGVKGHFFPSPHHFILQLLLLSFLCCFCTQIKWEKGSWWNNPYFLSPCNFIHSFPALTNNDIIITEREKKMMVNNNPPKQIGVISCFKNFVAGFFFLQEGEKWQLLLSPKINCDGFRLASLRFFGLGQWEEPERELRLNYPSCSASFSLLPPQ